MHSNIIDPSVLLHRNDIKKVQMETSSVCNAACPMCARELPPFDKKKDAVSLSLEKVKEILSIEFISNLEYLDMCGNTGDPAAAPDTIKIFKYFRDINNTMSFGMHTNGSLRNKQWWEDLGSVLSRPGDSCTFSVDGLEDTNHIYRVNTVFKKIIENSSAFIAAGGRANWDFLVFEHNEHQVEDARKLAKELGFVRFRTKVSNRFFRFDIKHLKPPKGKIYQ